MQFAFQRKVTQNIHCPHAAPDPPVPSTQKIQSLFSIKSSACPLSLFSNLSVVSVWLEPLPAQPTPRLPFALIKQLLWVTRTWSLA